MAINNKYGADNSIHIAKIKLATPKYTPNKAETSQ
jgi:hypothetical protein